MGNYALRVNLNRFCHSMLEMGGERLKCEAGDNCYYLTPILMDQEQ